MANVYSVRLAGPLFLDTTLGTVYTCPSGIVAILRSIVISNASSSGVAEVQVHINSGAGTRFLTVSVPTLSSEVLDVRVPLTAGEFVTARRVTGTPNLTIGGYELQA